MLFSIMSIDKPPNRFMFVHFQSLKNFQREIQTRQIRAGLDLGDVCARGPCIVCQLLLRQVLFIAVLFDRFSEHFRVP